MNLTVPLMPILFAASGAILLWFLYRAVSVVKLSAERIAEDLISTRIALIAATEAVHQINQAVGPASAELQANMPAVPKLLEAVAKVGQAQLEMMQAQRAAAIQHEANPFGRSTGPVAARDVAGSNLEYDVTQMMRADGVTREEALLRLNPANAASVWDGVFQGWGN